MIKIKTKYDFDGNIFTLDKFEHKNSCTYEFVALISTLIDEIVNQEEMSRKDVYKMVKDFDKAVEEYNAHQGE